MTHSQRINFSLVFLLLSICVRSQAAAENRVKSQARWDESEKNPRLIINVADVLTPSQREIINSGFTTFSVFTLDEKNESSGISLVPFKRSCTVKYDTWEDRYEVNKIEPAPFQSETVKDYKSWSHLCLEIVVEDPRLLNLFEQSGEITATLNVRQSTPEEGAKIKTWLVKQQSGFMQGLYSHMLGNFQYQHMSVVRIGIPKRTSDKPRQGVPKS